METVTVFSIAISAYVQSIKIEVLNLFENWERHSINRLQRRGHITTSGVHNFSNNFNSLESQSHIETLFRWFVSWHLTCFYGSPFLPLNTKIKKGYCVSQQCSAAASTNRIFKLNCFKNLATAAKLFYWNKIFYLFILLFTDNKFMCASPRVCAMRVCTVCASVRENGRKKAWFPYRKKGGRHGNSLSFFTLLFVIFICSMSSGVLVILLL